jgi:hypothetical protein
MRLAWFDLKAVAFGTRRRHVGGFELDALPIDHRSVLAPSKLEHISRREHQRDEHTVATVRSACCCARRHRRAHAQTLLAPAHGLCLEPPGDVLGELVEIARLFCLV